MKRFFLYITLLSLLTLTLTGCNNKSKKTSAEKELSDAVDDFNENFSSDDDKEKNDENKEKENKTDENSVDENNVDENIKDENQAENQDDKETATLTNSGIKTISEFSDYWYKLYSGNDKVIYESTNAPVLDLVIPGTCFITGVQYDLLNIENKDGRFEGELILAGYDGFIEKEGSKLIFGYDDILDKDSFTPDQAKGDRMVENGTCDLDKGHYIQEEFTERNGVKINRSANEYKIEKDGSISALYQNGDSLDYNNNESLDNLFVFIRNGENKFDYVVANAEIGPEFKIIALEDDMSKSKALELFKNAGYTIISSGEIKDGALVTD